MKVTMLILETPENFDQRNGGPGAQEYWDAWKSYSEAVSDKVVGGNVLAGKETAITLRVRGGERQIQDGPFADSKEALGGYMVFEVKGHGRSPRAGRLVPRRRQRCGRAAARRRYAYHVDGMSDAHQQVALAARESYGRLLAWLTSRCGSIATAEDALGDALASALDQWPRQGLPQNPPAWLLSVARRRLIDRRRRDTTKKNAHADLEYAEALRLHREAVEATEVPFRRQLPERRLELMFMCAHPEIPEAMRTPLMLQAVLGLTAQEIASVLLVAPTTIGQRLVRVKRLIVERRIPFEVPSDRELPGRLRHVLDAIYAAYAKGWEDESEECGYRLWLAGLLVRAMPQSGEAKGLYALLCLCESRRGARRAPDGSYVPLHEQDTARWDAEMILEGKKALWLAIRHGDHGYYQAEASIQLVHSRPGPQRHHPLAPHPRRVSPPGLALPLAGGVDRLRRQLWPGR